MSKMLDYIDREKTTIAILKDYHDQLWKLENDRRLIRELNEDITSPKGMSSTPVHGGGSRREETLCSVIDKKDVLEKGYKQAQQYHVEFAPCWEQLTDTERDILSLRFIEHYESGGIKNIMRKYNISKSEAYNRSNYALKRLAGLLFW